MSRVLFVGQAPGSKNSQPFVGRSGCRLAAFLDVTVEDMFAKHNFVNLVDQWQGKVGKGDAFKVERGVDLNAKIADAVGMSVAVVFCGSGVAKALKITQPLLDKFEYGGKPAMVLPHPSGVNRWWNDMQKRKGAIKRLRAFVSTVTR